MNYAIRILTKQIENHTFSVKKIRECIFWTNKPLQNYTFWVWGGGNLYQFVSSSDWLQILLQHPWNTFLFEEISIVLLLSSTLLPITQPCSEESQTLFQYYSSPNIKLKNHSGWRLLLKQSWWIRCNMNERRNEEVVWRKDYDNNGDR